MLKLELVHYYENGKQTEFDYSHLSEEKRDIVSRGSYSQIYVTFGRGLTLEYKSTYIGDGDSVGSVAVWDSVENKPVWFGLGYENMERNRNEEIDYDATPEVKQAYAEYKAEEERKRKEIERKHDAWLAAERAKIEAAIPRKGKTVRVVRGRKVPINTMGKVFWLGQTPYGESVGIELFDKSRVFTASRNVEVVPNNLDLIEKVAKERGLW
jgi:hypothetical protein